MTSPKLVSTMRIWDATQKLQSKTILVIFCVSVAAVSVAGLLTCSQGASFPDAAIVLYNTEGSPLVQQRLLPRVTMIGDIRIVDAATGFKYSDPRLSVAVKWKYIRSFLGTDYYEVQLGETGRGERAAYSGGTQFLVVGSAYRLAIEERGNLDQEQRQLADFPNN